jgi:hypothetical protein
MHIKFPRKLSPFADVSGGCKHTERSNSPADVAASKPFIPSDVQRKHFVLLRIKQGRQLLVAAYPARCNQRSSAEMVPIHVDALVRLLPTPV